MANSKRLTKYPYIGVKSPWTGELLKYKEDSFASPDEFLENYGIRNGYIKRTPRKDNNNG